MTVVNSCVTEPFLEPGYAMMLGHLIPPSVDHAEGLAHGVLCVYGRLVGNQAYPCTSGMEL
jgi:hypothetical protein